MVNRLIQKIKDWFRGQPLFGGIPRNSKWPQARKTFLNIHSSCAVCDRKSSFLKPLEVHHIVPFHTDKSLELDFDNLIVLCREHHLLVGHLMSWSSFNKDVYKDAKTWIIRIKNRP